MTKTLTEAQITTAKARSKLGAGVHWRRLDAEAHLGYRRGKRGGVWLVRWRNHYDGANYKQAQIGIANDINDKPTEGTLTFEQAAKEARDFVIHSRTEAAAHASGPAPTVRTAVEAYVNERNARDSRRSGREVRSDGCALMRTDPAPRFWKSVRPRRTGHVRGFMDHYISMTRLLTAELRQCTANSRVLLRQAQELLRMADLLASPLITTTLLRRSEDRTTGDGKYFPSSRSS